MKYTEGLKISHIVATHEEGLRRMRDMWLDPNVFFYDDEVPEKKEGDTMIFLLGPTSRDGIPDYMWRKDAVHYLRSAKYVGKILIPEYRGGSYLSLEGTADFTDARKIFVWEHNGIRRSSALLAWIPRNGQQLLGLTTNRELGQAMGRAEHDKKWSKRLFIGWPENAKNMGSIGFELEDAKVGHLEGGHFDSLQKMCEKVASLFEAEDDIPF